MNDNDRDAIEERAQAAEAMAQGLLDHARKLRSGEVSPQVIEPAMDGSSDILQESLAALRDLRVRQAKYLGTYVQEPALDLLLMLFAAHLGKTILEVEDLCGSIGRHRTSARRWLDVFEDDGLVEIVHDGQARQHVKLSADGAVRIGRALVNDLPGTCLQ